MTKASQVVVLSEDVRHVQFARRYLYRLGYSNHDIRVKPLASGRGCGEQWVRKHYADAVAEHRDRSIRARTALVVIIDEDAGRTSRAAQLEQALYLAKVAGRQENEAITHLIPKRNIETWVLCLTGTPVNEVADYRHHNAIDNEMVKTAGITFYHWSRPNASPPGHCIPSLHIAIPEIRRIE